MIIYGIILSVKIINKDFKNISFWLLLLSVFLNSQIGLGRFGYFEVLVYIIIIYLIVNTSKKNSMKLSINTKRLSQLFIMTIVGTSIALIMSYTLLIRQGRENISFYETFNGLYTLFDQAIVYFIGPFRTLDYSLQHYVNNKYFWGRLTFGGIEQLISFVLLPLNLETAYESITPLIQTPIVIGYNDRTFNAFYTSIINHYLDFRIPGVAVFSYAHGYIVRKAFDYYDSNKNIMVLCLLTYRSLMTVLLWGYQTSNAWVAVIIMLMISREKTVTLNDEIPN